MARGAALDPADGSRLITTADSTEPVGGIPAATPGEDGQPVEPRLSKPDIPFEISAVATRTLEGGQGIRTAATVQQLLDQASVVDVKTDLLAPVREEAPREAPRKVGLVRGEDCGRASSTRGFG